MRRVYGLHGYTGAGKDTIFNMLAERTEVYRLAFGDALKEESAAAYGVTVEFLNNRETKEMPLPELAPRFCRDADFIEVLKRDLGVVFDMDMPMSPRRVMQLWGTDYRRAQDDNYWVERVADKIQKLPEDAVVFITDVRDPGDIDNESEYVRTRMSGIIIHVENPNAPETIAHVSNKKIAFMPGDRVVMNDKGLEELAAAVEVLMQELELPFTRMKLADAPRMRVAA